MAFYDVFERLCNEKGATPTQVARDNGIKQSVVAMWKKRGSTPKAETIQKLADYFGVSMAYLLGEKDFKKEFSLQETAELLPNAVIVPFEGNETARPGLYIDLIASGYLDTKDRLDLAFNALNENGQQKAVERVEELTEIPRYRRQEPQEPLAVPPEGKDTTPSSDAPERPAEGK